MLQFGTGQTKNRTRVAKDFLNFCFLFSNKKKKKKKQEQTNTERANSKIPDFSEMIQKKGGRE